ncbi:hypothetical protein [Streptacidiphilus fuscans]|uniref:Uncharacterized protein n=1 Tax=Streptacidiphilus fuscans TaxID=2789292 RepID=A0A931BE28_9ACTN|nr:hypothetical protein [Streptacidiphilus fuscans]MBF9073936.1 hypothetical protein [Streptacidiphilus fuscans]
MIPHLDDVTVVADHHYNSAAFDVLPAGARTPVMRVHKDHVFTSRHP